MTTVNYKKLLLLATLPAMMLASCSKEEPGGNDADSRTPVAFTAVVQSTALPQHTNIGGSAPATRTALDSDGNTVWTAGDAVSISMLTPGGTLPDDLVPGRANVLHNVDPMSGALTPAGGTPMYYPQNTAVDFVAWHSAKAPDDNYILTLNTTDQTTAEKQLALDILYSDNAGGIARSNNPVALQFCHLMSKVKFDITLGLGLSGGTLTDVRLAGFPEEGSFDMRDGSVNKSLTTDEPVRALKSAVTPVGADASYTALLIPLAADSPRTIVVTVNGKEYTGTLPATDAYAANTMYTYPVTVRETGVEVGMPTTDVPWTESELLTVTLDNKPFRIIRNAVDLKRFADDVNGGQRDLNALQTADIDLGGIDNWEPINYVNDLTSSFTGIYNGNGYTISHLRISRSQRIYNGLFGQIGSGALLTGIHLRDVEIIPDRSGIACGTLAGLVLWGATVSLCSAQGKINMSGSGTQVGGLVGSNIGTVTRCRTDVTVKIDVTLENQLLESAGGITGRNEGLVFACHAIGSVTLKGRYKDNTASGRLYAGGIVGMNLSSSYNDNIYCCIAEGDVTIISETEGLSGDAGGLAGYHQGGAIRSCYARGNASFAGTTSSGAAGAIVGRRMSQDDIISCCYGVGAGGKGTSNISPKINDIVYNTNPGAGEILTLMKASGKAFTVLFTRYDPDATPAYGIVVQRKSSLMAKDFWLSGNGTWPVIDFARNPD
ncbi:fimbrillin family protein [Bacteroides xylanisolvens]|uniref:fimbrillin family protein n=2 Tax=Bacteroides xylanisolvens TaxID=371601 RepID=UPI0039B385F9